MNTQQTWLVKLRLTDYWQMHFIPNYYACGLQVMIIFIIDYFSNGVIILKSIKVCLSLQFVQKKSFSIYSNNKTAAESSLLRNLWLIVFAWEKTSLVSLYYIFLLSYDFCISHLKGCTNSYFYYWLVCHPNGDIVWSIKRQKIGKNSQSSMTGLLIACSFPVQNPQNTQFTVF